MHEAMAVWGAPRPCRACGAAVQLARWPHRLPLLLDAGTRRRHSCGPISWCGCGAPVYARWDGQRCNVGDDRVHACAAERAPAPPRKEPAPAAPAPSRPPPSDRRRAPAGAAGIDVPEVRS